MSLRLGNLVRHLDGSLRRCELILTAPFERRIVLLLADTDEAGAWGLRSHIGGLAQQAELDLRMSVAVFPSDGLTFQELLYRASRELALDASVAEAEGTANDDRQLEAG